MSIKSEYANLDEIPETLNAKDLFEERDGKYVLKKDAIEDIRTEADISRLQTALKNEREQTKGFKSQVEELRQSIEELKNSPAPKNEDSNSTSLSKVELRELNILKEKVEKMEKEKAKLEKEMNDKQLKEQVLKAAVDAGVKSEAVEDALLWAEKLFIVDSGVVVTPDEEKPITPADWFESLKSGNKKTHWFDVKPQGVGAKGSKSTSRLGPKSELFNEKNLNLTKFMEAYKENPEEMDKKARQLGFKDAKEFAFKSKRK